MLIKDAISWAMSLSLEKNDVQILLLHALGRSTFDKAYLIAHDQDPLSSNIFEQFSELITRAHRSEPIAYITGHKEFYGLNFKVTPDTLIPRPDTETLVEWAIECLKTLKVLGRPPRVLDLGTGTGCLAITIKHHLPSCIVWASDIKNTTLEVAKHNSKALKTEINFLEGSWFKALEGETLKDNFDLIISNPPYIKANDSHLASLTFEPEHALISGAEGLDDLKIIALNALEHLTPGGWLLVEHGYNQGLEVQSLLHQNGLIEVQSRHDIAGICRCTGGQRPKME